jgi:TadE-like protein
MPRAPGPVPSAERGQASVETLALVPAVLLLALAAWQGIVVAWAALRLDDAAHAGARAALAGEPPAPAVNAALPPSLRPATVTVARGRVVVRAAAPVVPAALAPTLTASAVVAEAPSDAAPAPAPSAPPPTP